MNGVPTDFWGKLEKVDGEPPTAWHPLPHHCADVAACAEMLLSQRVLRRRLASCGGQADLSDVQVARLSALAALHDLGKFNAGFQAKREARPARVAGHVGPAIAHFQRLTLVSGRIWTSLRFDDFLPWTKSEEGVQRLLVAAIAHHGRPIEPSPTEGSVDWWVASGALDPFAGLADLGERVRQWFPLAFEHGTEPLPESPAFQHAFSGLVMLADWLGSDRKIFLFSKSVDADPMPLARQRAAEVAVRMGFDTTGPRRVLGDEPVAFDRVSSFPPRALQRALLELPTGKGGGVAILESETGSGKTEAAMARFLRLFQAGAVDGLYFALPTRTAATQIHRRVFEAAERAFGPAAPPVVLAVPGYLSVDDKEGVRLAEFEVLWNDEDRERIRYRAWAAENPKRYLAGAIVVGTIDQVLLSVLAVGHAQLRATALLRHLLVVDEVHASDVYMTRLLEEVLARHLGAGGHALLMSATLGAEARARLSAPRQVPALLTLEEAIAVPYPVLLNLPREGEQLRQEIPPNGRSRDIRVEREPLMGDAEAVARRAMDAAASGARVVVLRNTVKECMRTQHALEALAKAEGKTELLFTCGGVIAPHHSRFARDDRTALDTALEAAFGTASPSRGCVLSATQTIQQALDIDADFFITDLCPMDVLLQRLGRLHRHPRARPRGFEAARAAVLVPASRDLSVLLNGHGGRWGLGSVYEDMRILEATWRQLEAHPVMTIPLMNRALVEHSTHPAVLSQITRELGGSWGKHETAMSGKAIAHRIFGGQATFDWNTAPQEQAGRFAGTERPSTRLGENDRNAELPRGTIGPFGREIRRLSFPGYLVSETPVDATIMNLSQLGRSLRFDYGPASFVYDRLGLRPDDGTAA